MSCPRSQMCIMFCTHFPPAQHDLGLLFLRARGPSPMGESPKCSLTLDEFQLGRQNGSKNADEKLYDARMDAGQSSLEQPSDVLRQLSNRSLASATSSSYARLHASSPAATAAFKRYLSSDTKGKIQKVASKSHSHSCGLQSLASSCGDICRPSRRIPWSSS